jgi:hypothetical protein
VPRGGFEPPWEFSHHALNVARLPFRHLGKIGNQEIGDQGIRLNIPSVYLTMPSLLDRQLHQSAYHG